MKLKKIIKENVNNFINEVKKTSYKFGCLMLNYKVTKTWWDELQAIIDEKDITRVDGAYGREKYRDAHVTILYGFHAGVELDDIKEATTKYSVRDIRVEKIGYFEGSSYDVVKIDLNYQFLKDLNREMKEFPYTNSFPKYQAHMTIAYVKKGKGKAYAQTLSTKLKKTLRPSEFLYSNKKGEKIKFDIEKKV